MNAHSRFQALSSSQEDYLCAVATLVRDGGVAKVRDIARLRAVKPGSATPAMRLLAARGLVAHAKRESVTLTAEGRDAVRRIEKKRQTVFAFFCRILQMDEPTARRQTDAVAHALFPETMSQMNALLAHPPVSAIPLPSAPQAPERTIASMAPGEEATVSLIRAVGEAHHRLIDMGLLPDARIRLVRRTAGHRQVVALGGFEITLDEEQARAVVVLS